MVGNGQGHGDWWSEAHGHRSVRDAQRLAAEVRGSPVYEESSDEERIVRVQGMCSGSRETVDISVDKTGLATTPSRERFLRTSNEHLTRISVVTWV